jgi:hypothetical protein
MEKIIAFSVENREVDLDELIVLMQTIPDDVARDYCLIVTNAINHLLRIRTIIKAETPREIKHLWSDLDEEQQQDLSAIIVCLSSPTREEKDQIKKLLDHSHLNPTYTAEKYERGASVLSAAKACGNFSEHSDILKALAEVFDLMAIDENFGKLCLQKLVRFEDNQIKNLQDICEIISKNVSERN